MAVIYRQRLTGEAADIKNQALKSLASDPSLVSLNQQKSVLEAQQQGLISSVQNSLQDVSKNIYKAQRQAKANSAALGYIGSLASLRQQSDLQSDISTEYSNLINQAEQGAISIAGQQTAINKAEVQLASDAILNQWVDNLIAEGKTDIISRDYNRELNYQFQQAGIGLLKGLAIGLGASFGIKGLLGQGGGLSKAIAGATVVGTLGYTSNTIAEASGGKGDLGLSLGISGGVGGSLGLLWGLGSKGGDLTKTAFENFTSPLRESEGYFNWATKRAAKKAAQQAATKAAQQAATTAAQTVGKSAIRTVGSSIGQAFKAGGSKILSAASRISPWTLAIAGGTSLLFGILDGIKARNTKFYKLNYDNLVNTNTGQQLSDFGVDLEAVKDIVYNKRG